MTRSANPFRTLESLRTELQARIGAAAGIAFAKPLLDSFLQGAQEALYELVPWKHLWASATITVANGSVWYDLPADCDLERIESVSILYGGSWLPLVQGIELRHRNFSTPGTPSRYDVRWNASATGAWKVQVELHPVPSQDGTLRVEYQRTCLRFTEDNDEASIPTGPLFLHALTNAKMHYRQPDGPAYAKQLEAMLTELKGRHRRATVVSPRRVRPMLDEDAVYNFPPTDYPSGG
jgi:hypothetical protein